jgi:hypothetical protein
MPNESAERFTYARDAERRIVRVTTRHVLTVDDLVAIIDRQREEGSWTFGILYDMRRLEGPMSKEDTMRVANHVRQSVSEHGPRGPVALVTRKSDLVGAGLVYAHDIKRSTEIEVFWDVQEADEWLTKRLLQQS